ncbi:MAG: sodium:proton exchanger [bacterium]|nr:sodium:proton exchanger [bacterium]
MNPEIFTELSVILFITLVVTGFIRLLKQPAIIGYLISGILAGPVVFNIIDSHDTLSAFSQIGIALLLFLVGLNLNPRVIKEVGKIALITGVGQVLFTTSIGFFIAKALGFSNTASFYLAIALAFSSTIIIMKLLSDKRDLETVYGRISIGFLIVQDFIAILALLVISTLNTGVDFASVALETILKGSGGIVVLFLLTIYVLPRLTKIIAKSQEFLLLFSLSWCFIVASAFHYINFSIEAGALLAGITLSMSPYHFEISCRMRPLRDFFLILFFIVLGSQMVFSSILSNLTAILLMSFFVLIGNPIIVMMLMGSLGYTKRNSFLAGLTVAQISEFSLIIIAMGVSLGHLNNETLSLVTAVGLITFAGSTYMIMYSQKIYPKISKFLSIFERKGKKVDEHKYHEHDDHDIILFGYNRIGLDILESLKKIKKKFFIIDYDPEVITKLSKEGYDCRYGDANDSELLDELNLARAKMIISTIPLIDTNLLIINKVKEVNKKAIVVVVSHQIEEAEMLYEAGATYVIMPHFLGGQHFSTMLERNKLRVDKFLEEKIAHLEHINNRKQLGHDHPTHHHR